MSSQVSPLGTRQVRRKIELWQAVLIVAVSLAAGVLPLLIGELLGFGGFVVTPVVMVFVLVWLGGAIARIVPAARWRGVALGALVLAVAFVLAPFFAEWAMNGRPPPLGVVLRPIAPALLVPVAPTG